VKHAEYEGRMMARAVFCLSRSQQEKLPAWEDGQISVQPVARGLFAAAMPSVSSASSAMPSRDFNGFTF
jgi:hypothetical protein